MGALLIFLENFSFISICFLFIWASRLKHKYRVRFSLHNNVFLSEMLKVAAVSFFETRWKKKEEIPIAYINKVAN